MLTNLIIKNYALIQHLEMRPVDGLNIITGETGAGKSIMLGAVGLLLGNRADTRVLFNEEAKCIIEGSFSIEDYNLQGFFKVQELDYEPETIIRREISPSGKSRAFINDTPVTLDVLRTLGDQLMDVHSQHETLLLAKSGFQMDLVDAFAGILDERADFRKIYREYKKHQEELKRLLEIRTKKEQEADYRHFILQELIDANLQSGEQEELEQQLTVLENAEEIKSNLTAANNILQEDEYSALQAIRQAQQFLNSLRKFSSDYESIYERIRSAFIEIDDLASELVRLNDLVEFDPEKTEIIQQRLGSIYQLQQKHHVNSIDELIRIREELDAEAFESGTMEERIVSLERLLEEQKIALSARAESLSKKRADVLEPLSHEMQELLKKVGIPDARIRIDLKTAAEEFTEFGNDEINLLFSANLGVAPQQLSKVASGGEFSRLMFCIKHILADKVALPTIIFDEIDTGISGEIALRMGEMMKFMSKNHQVIAISHLPQIAARAERHYFVYKDRGENSTISKIRMLSEEERTIEIAKMIGGDSPSDTALQNARELMTHN
ncbi:DNA repair protein RecN [Fulvivirga sedimenti]|uniref:DNA repair protein RecN n=1 Tax=Fulvivirga sedimenti TaxID=2879465 RepID=A0A9X1HKL4_9BACT|nr:DNA repair protein RecN [Fulvivirga sedimenti]MCA6073918.1 DNA repair protein RecN [Fulvivirga sedimenti]